ncbi:hypothetical protein CYMTET_37730 [Cymbomonas tetramitiformis]|uniref:Uncharacterized protein n=1 Tax=Cymbomonas tetramitiformis TaxID=36881 RepID=A0AAE0CDG8_9CHLO|nr:hypothetical protein CYMTET_37730 [Cymbomonas tetramitiformis]
MTLFPAQVLQPPPPPEYEYTYDYEVVQEDDDDDETRASPNAEIISAPQSFTRRSGNNAMDSDNEKVDDNDYPDYLSSTSPAKPIGGRSKVPQSDTTGKARTNATANRDPTYNRSSQTSPPGNDLKVLAEDLMSPAKDAQKFARPRGPIG